MLTANSPTDPADALAEAEPIISRIARRFRFHTDDREDAKQEARLAFLRALPTFDPARAEIRKFANKVVKNALIDFKRRLDAEHRKAETLADDVATDEDEGGAGADQFIHQLMTRPDDILTKRQSRLFQLFICTDSRTELADILGISNDIADQRISRLRRDLLQMAAA